jgi:hypothetical protein
MPKKRLTKALLIVLLVLLVPFLIGRVTTAVLEATDPRPAATAARDIQSRAESAIRSLERARTMTRITLVVIAVYYVGLIACWLILRHQKRKSLRS